MRRDINRASAMVLFAMLALSASAAAQSAIPPQFGITVDRDPIVQGDPFELTISIATESATEPEIRLPQFRGLRVLRQSESHPRSFSMSFSLGGQTQRQIKRTSKYSFVLVADRPGDHHLEPVLVTIDGRQYKSDPYTLKVVKSGPTSAVPDPGAAGTPVPDPGVVPHPGSPPEIERHIDEDDLAGAKIDPACFVQLEVSKAEAVVGEMLVLTVWLYTSSRISNVEVTREPGTEGFWVETLLTGQRRLTFEPVTVGGRQYERGVLRKLALFPIEPGTLTISPVMVNVETRRGGLFSRATVIKRASSAVRIDVSGLPADGQPAGFDPANVGRFEYRVETDKNKVEVGEPVTLTISVSGEGNLRNVNLPQLTEVEGFKVYPPENEVNLHPSEQNVVGTRVSRVLMIPHRHGSLTIPAVPWSFFDPAAGAYRKAGSRPTTIEVKAGAQSDGAADGAAESAGGPRSRPGDASDRLAGQLRSIESITILDPAGETLTMTRPWYLAAILAAPLGYLALLLGYRARKRAAQLRGRDRWRRAGAVARKDLAALRRRSEQLPAAEFFGGLHKVLIRFLESRLTAAVAGDTMEELRRRLAGRGFPEGLAERVLTELEGCDFARFARSAQTAAERGQALDRMQALIDDLAAVAVSEPAEEKTG